MNMIREADSCSSVQTGMMEESHQELILLHQDLSLLLGGLTSQFPVAQPPWSPGLPLQVRFSLIRGRLLLSVQVLLKPSSLGDFNRPKDRGGLCLAGMGGMH